MYIKHQFESICYPKKSIPLANKTATEIRDTAIQWSSDNQLINKWNLTPALHSMHARKLIVRHGLFFYVSFLIWFLLNLMPPSKCAVLLTLWWYVCPASICKIIGIHHGYSCRIGISHQLSEIFRQCDEALPSHLAKMSVPRVRYPYPTWINELVDLFSPI